MGSSTIQILLAQRIIALLIPAEQADFRSISAHCAEWTRTQYHSPLWENRVKTNHLSVYIRSDPPDGWKIGPPSCLDFADRIRSDSDGC